MISEGKGQNLFPELKEFFAWAQFCLQLWLVVGSIAKREESVVVNSQLGLVSPNCHYILGIPFHVAVIFRQFTCSGNEIAGVW